MLLLLDLKDLQSLLANLSERSAEISKRLGNVSKQSVSAIQRSLLVLENQGGAHFFGEPALEIADLMRTTRDGRGSINILAADKLMMSPRLYATFLLWLLSELFEEKKYFVKKNDKEHGSYKHFKLYVITNILTFQTVSNCNV